MSWDSRIFSFFFSFFFLEYNELAPQKKKLELKDLGARGGKSVELGVVSDNRRMVGVGCYLDKIWMFLSVGEEAEEERCYIPVQYSPMETLSHLTSLPTWIHVIGSANLLFPFTLWPL